MEKKKFSERVIEIISNIPYGKVISYGKIARLAGNPRGSRQVSWILSSSSQKYNLPWHRVINKRGQISLKPGQGFEEQKSRLEKENVEFCDDITVDLNKSEWKIEELRRKE